MPAERSSPETAWSASDLADDPHGREDKAQRVQRMFAAIAGSYDLNNRVHSFGLDRGWRSVAVSMAGPKPSDRVLDVACGTGDLSEAFARAGVAQVVGVDFTAAMLDIARTKATRVADRVGSIEYREGDAMALDLPDASFDVVSIAFGIRNVSEPTRALAEFHRVLKPRGRLVVLEFTRPSSRILALGHAIYTRCVMPFTATLLARDRSGAYCYLPRSVETFPDHHGLAELIRQTGLIVAEQRVLSMGTCAVTLATKAPAP